MLMVIVFIYLSCYIQSRLRQTIRTRSDLNIFIFILNTYFDYLSILLPTWANFVCVCLALGAPPSSRSAYRKYPTNYLLRCTITSSRPKTVEEKSNFHPTHWKLSILVVLKMYNPPDQLKFNRNIYWSRKTKTNFE